MRREEAAIVTHRLFAAFPESAQVRREGNRPGTRDEYERWFMAYPRETGDAIVSKAVVRYEWLPKIKHLTIIAQEVAGDGSFAKLKDRWLEIAKWAVFQTSRGLEGMTVRSFLEGELREHREILARQQRDEEQGWLGGVKERAHTERVVAVIEALLAEVDERGGHRDHGDPQQIPLGTAVEAVAE